MAHFSDSSQYQSNLENRVANLEFLLKDIHWVLVGQFMNPLCIESDPCELDHADNGGSTSKSKSRTLRAKQVRRKLWQSISNHYHAVASHHLGASVSNEFGCDNTKSTFDLNSGDFRSLPKSAWDVLHSHFAHVKIATISDSSPSACSVSSSRGVTHIEQAANAEGRTIEVGNTTDAQGEAWVPHEAVEMVLPVTRLNTIVGGSIRYPLDLQRSSYTANLSSNPELLMMIEMGMELGAACRRDWQENSLDDQCGENEAWNQEEVLSWTRTVLDRAIECDDKFEGASLLWLEWFRARPHIEPKSQDTLMRVLDSRLQSNGFPSFEAVREQTLREQAGARG